MPLKSSEYCYGRVLGGRETKYVCLSSAKLEVNIEVLKNKFRAGFVALVFGQTHTCSGEP